MSAPVAGIHVTAENRRPAVLYRVQNAKVSGVQQLTILLAKLFSVGADDIGHLAGRPFCHDSF